MPKTTEQDIRPSLFPDNFKLVILAIVVMCVLMFVEPFFANYINQLGLIPKSTQHLTGIVTSPFVHGSWGHLSGNIVGLLVSGYLASLQPKFKRVTVFIFITTGTLVWLFGEYANHVGASGIVMGYYGFLFGTAVFNRNLIAIVSFAVLVAFTYYADFAFFSTLLDFSPQTSSTSHIFGFLSGLLGAYLFKGQKIILGTKR